MTTPPESFPPSDNSEQIPSVEPSVAFPRFAPPLATHFGEDGYARYDSPVRPLTPTSFCEFSMICFEFRLTIPSNIFFDQHNGLKDVSSGI